MTNVITWRHLDEPAAPGNTSVYKKPPAFASWPAVLFQPHFPALALRHPHVCDTVSLQQLGRATTDHRSRSCGLPDGRGSSERLLQLAARGDLRRREVGARGLFGAGSYGFSPGLVEEGLADSVTTCK